MSEAKDIFEQIRANVLDVRRRIDRAAKRAGRRPEDIVLLAASKTRTIEEIEMAARAGIRVAGENRVQELLAKQPGPAGLEWHFIGHLQTNKVRQVVGRVGLIHSVDSTRLAVEIGRRAEAAGLVQPVLLQVNVAGEESKTGFTPGELEKTFEEVSRVAGVEIRGLSTIAPLVEDPESVRGVFRAVREKMEGMTVGEPGVLSMGMTGDFEVAVEEGSTIVRVGTALFGRRS